MSSLTIDEKIHLLQKMRNQANAYPRHTGYSASGAVRNKAEFTDTKTEHADESYGEKSYLKHRILLCIVIFFTCFALHKSSFSLKGYSLTELAVFLEDNKIPETVHNSLESVSTKIIDSIMKS